MISFASGAGLSIKEATYYNEELVIEAANARYKARKEMMLELYSLVRWQTKWIIKAITGEDVDMAALLPLPGDPSPEIEDDDFEETIRKMDEARMAQFDLIDGKWVKKSEKAKT